MKGSPTVLLLLFVDGDDIVQRDTIGEELQALAPAFVNKRTGQAFLGYLDAQRRGLVGDRHATRTRELSERHGYDTKYAMHALRIAVQGIELVTERRITLPVPEPHRARLMAVRRGEPSLDEVVEELDRSSAALAELIENSDLPATPDAARVDRFLVDAYERAWSARAAGA